MRASVSASAIRGAYIDEATKRALLGSGNSFGLPMSTGTSFKLSALDEAPVILVPSTTDKMILPLHIICGASEKLPADVVAMFGWPNPDPENPTEHDEPWLGAATTIAHGNADQGSLVLLPNSGALPVPRLWPECLLSRAFAVSTGAGAEAEAASRSKKKRAEEKDEAEAESRYQAKNRAKAEAREGEEEPPDPELNIVVFYTVF